MPYRKVSELPKNVKDHIPKHAQEIYRKAYNSAFNQYDAPSKRKGSASREETAHKVAWNAVKQKYQKQGSDWKPKAQA